MDILTSPQFYAGLIIGVIIGVWVMGLAYMSHDIEENNE